MVDFAKALSKIRQFCLQLIFAHESSRMTYRKHKELMKDLLGQHFSIWSAPQMCVLNSMSRQFGIRCVISGGGTTNPHLAKGPLKGFKDGCLLLATPPVP